MVPCYVCDSPRLEPVHAATRPLGLVSDESRRGNRLVDRPIVGLAEATAGATAFIPMSRNVAERIIARAGGLPIAFRYLDWNRVDPVAGVVRPPSEAHEARRRA